MIRALALGLAVLAAGCAPPRAVDVSEQPSGSLLAVARGDAGAPCSDEQRTRAVEEARYYCTARGRKAVFGAKGPHPAPEGCSYRAEFWCAAQ